MAHAKEHQKGGFEDMPYTDFHSAFPDVAEAETRSITLTHHSFGLPPDQYAFLEMYCDEPGCDCRRVFFSVISLHSNDVLAVITYGWESRDYYVRWLGRDIPDIIADLTGSALNLASPQSALAPALLELFRKLLLPDAAYIDRIKRHYAMFREKIERRQQAAKSRKKRKRWK
jgi:hypothetical protein